MGTAKCTFTLTGEFDIDAIRLLEALAEASKPKYQVKIKFGPVSEKPQQGDKSDDSHTNTADCSAIRS